MVFGIFRFQELAGTLEKSLITPFNESSAEKSRSNFQTTEVLLNALVSCFDQNIYLPPLAHRCDKT